MQIHVLRGAYTRLLILAVVLTAACPPLFARVWTVPASQQLEHDAQEALLLAAPGDTVLLPAGRFNLSVELTINNPYITLKGQGMDKTVLVYGESAAGPQAIIATAAHSTVEDLTILDHPGDGVKMIGVNGGSIRRVKVEWTKHGSPDNGGYGLYPVQSSNVLIEDCIVIGASDAGIYVGQSNQIIVRRNLVSYNVAGIEIENSQHADVYENEAKLNTGGVLVFNLPNLQVQGGKGTRIFRNSLHDNNYKNFAPAGNSVATVPQGTGVLILANDDVEIFENTIENHNTTSIAIMSFYALQLPIADPAFDAVPESISIHDNIFRNAGRWPLAGGNELGVAAAALSFPHRIPHISYDGMGRLDAKGEPQAADLQGERRICIGANDQDGGESSYFGNLQLWKSKWWSPIPGKLDRDLTPHSCEIPAFPTVQLAAVAPPPALEQGPSPEKIAELCANPGEGVNWEALAVDCPTLAAYRFFSAANDPFSAPTEGGFPYDLTTPLFSDYAQKSRLLFLPPGTSAGYENAAIFDLPEGSVLVKTFYFPPDLRQPSENRRPMETRLLIHRGQNWKALSYVWNPEGEAVLTRGGRTREVSWIDAEGQTRSNSYRIPNLAQCEGCHLANAPIGIKAGYLNREGHGAFAEQNQLQALAAQNRLRDLPAAEEIPRYPVWNDPRSGSLPARAKTYLDINCAHCHSVAGKAGTSGLYLNLGQTENINFGICKPPVAAGRGAGGTLFDIVPGKPQESILIGRMNSTKAAVKMPELAKSMAHDEGVALISSWISSLQGGCGK